MAGHGRPLLWTKLAAQSRPRTLLWSMLISFACIPAALCCADTAIPHENLPLAWQADAELTDVFFLDAQHGWAVGAQGVILRTTDGGDSWLEHGHVSAQSISDVPLQQKLKNMRNGTQSRWTGVAGSQSSIDRVRCRFESVHFVDELHGWVVGGYNVPWIDRSRAVIMHTTDGGVSWTRFDDMVIPRIRKIRFSGRQTGWAIGETSHLFPTGIYYTSDGGRSWSSPANVEMSHWIDGQQTGSGFVTIDQRGQLAVVNVNSVRRPVLSDCPPNYRVTCLQMLDGRHGWAAGERGLILKTTDGGVSWRRFPIDKTDTKTDASRTTFTCMAKSGDHLWLAAEFGSALFRIDTKTDRVTSSQLPANLPLKKIKFAGAEHGWAVGELGTILATTDGGQTWQKQRGQHERLAMLTVTRTAKDTPLDLLAINAGEESRICGSLVLDATPESISASIQATERVGSSLNWHWNPAESESEAVEYLIQAIRTLQPMVVVCCDPRAEPQSYRDSTLEQQVIRAIARAAKGNARQDLQPWQVERLVVSDRAGPVRFDPQRMLPAMGVQIADQVALSRALYGLPIAAAEPTAWRVAHPGRRRVMTGTDLLSGVGRVHRVPIRQGKTSLGNLNRLNQALSKQKQLQQFAKFVVETDQDLRVWHQKLLPFVLKMDEDVSGLWLIELADRYVCDGRFDMAAQTLHVLSTRWPNHAFSPAALAWLATWYGSDEMSQIDLVRTGGPDLQNENSRIGLASHEAELDPLVAKETQPVGTPFLPRVQEAGGLLRRLTQSDPDLAHQPGFEWLESRLLTKLSSQAANENKLQQMSESPRNLKNGFARAARWELDMIHDRTARPGDAAKFHCVFASQPPRLDGKLTDPVWDSMRSQGMVAEKSISTAGSDAANVTQPEPDLVLLARDDEFFYAAFRCQKLASQYYPFKKTARPRDPDLSRRDRIEFTIDTDMDFCTSVTFVVDHRGWVSEWASGGIGWDPDWFVAQDEDEESWTVEIAIPLKHFSHQQTARSENPRPWAVQIDRLGYHSRRLWRSTNQQLPTDCKGLQAGLAAQPQVYELMSFKSGDSPVR